MRDTNLPPLPHGWWIEISNYTPLKYNLHEKGKRKILYKLHYFFEERDMAYFLAARWYWLARLTYKKWHELNGDRDTINYLYQKLRKFEENGDAWMRVAEGGE